MKLEHALSPMIRNRSIITQNAEAEAIELIKQIKQLKLDVINQRIDKKEISNTAGNFGLLDSLF